MRGEEGGRDRKRRKWRRKDKVRLDEKRKSALAVVTREVRMRKGEGTLEFSDLCV